MPPPLGRAVMLVIGLLALATPGMALGNESSPGQMVPVTPRASGQTGQLSQEQVAQAYLDLVLPTNQLARAGSVFHERAWRSRDPVLIEQDMRMWVTVRKAFLRNLRRADFFPGDVRPRVEAVISATERQILAYGQGIGDRPEPRLRAVWTRRKSWPAPRGR